ncbi:MAG: CHAT domain-containing protein, partial [Prochlorotrichaceae cyanobacterium]
TQAMFAVETSRSWATTDERRREILENAIEVYHNALQCYVNQGRYEDAILLAERARSRQLVELMASADLYPQGQIAEPLAQYLAEYDDLQDQINRLRQNRDGDSGNSATGQYRSGSVQPVAQPVTLRVLHSQQQAIQSLEARKQSIWLKIRAEDPVVAGTKQVEHLQWSELTALLADLPTTALLSFYSTNDHTHGLVVRHRDGQLVAEGYPLPDQGYKTLHNWINQEWLGSYNPEDLQPWTIRMPSLLAELAQRLDLDRLVEKHLLGIEELILVPHISLHLIPFAALPLSSSPRPLGEGSGVRDYLGDRFRLRILPSVNVLKYCHDRQGGPAAPLVKGDQYGSVEGAGDASRDTSMAIAYNLSPAIATAYGILDTNRLVEQAATLNAYRDLVRSGVQGIHAIHHASA